MCVCMYVYVVCPETGLATGPQCFPELQWYVEEETSSRKEQILPREEETTSIEEQTSSRRPSSFYRFLPLNEWVSE